jgi:hypothetical protein
MGLGALVLVAFSIAITVGWIVAIFEVARIPSGQFYAAGSNKIVWILIVIFLQVFGALLWLILRRAEVLDAVDWADGDPPPDWYLDAGAQAYRWWDGAEWTDRYQTWSGARPQR